MLDYDVIIIGAGPAGLVAGLYISRGRHKVLALEKESFGGQIMNLGKIENYPGFAQGVSGTVLGSEMLTQATKSGLEIKLADVIGIDSHDRHIRVKCIGSEYVASAVIIAGGTHHKKLGIPGEDEFLRRGTFYCALCDGGQFIGRVVAVCGGGDSGVTEALYMTQVASKVILIEALPKLTASMILQERASINPKLEILCGVKVESIVGDNRVKAIDILETKTGKRSRLELDGVLIQVGLEPNTSYLKGVVPLDNQGRIVVNERMQTENPHILAAGDIRSGSPNQIATAVGDGATAAISAERLLLESQPKRG